jgi:vacuolar-type H+-ATPase subunit F/Vma7
MPNVVAIAKDQVALQLALTGVYVEEVKDAREAEQLLERHLDDGARVVIVQDDFRQGFSDYFQARLARHRGLPLVVYCPSFTEGESNVDAYISSVLKPAIGYEIRLD